MKTKPKQHWIHSIIKATLALVAVVFIGGCASVKPPSTPPDATVKISQWSAAYYGAAATGSGTLNYRGESFRFSMSGLGAGGIGGQKMSATGKVYNLHRLADFSGTYTGISKGLTLIKGVTHAKLKNQKGVVLYLAGKTVGLASSFGGRAFQISLKN